MADIDPWVVGYSSAAAVDEITFISTASHLIINENGNTLANPPLPNETASGLTSETGSGATSSAFYGFTSVTENVQVQRVADALGQTGGSTVFFSERRERSADFESFIAFASGHAVAVNGDEAGQTSQSGGTTNGTQWTTSSSSFETLSPAPIPAPVPAFGSGTGTLNAQTGSFIYITSTTGHTENISTETTNGDFTSRTSTTVQVGTTTWTTRPVDSKAVTTATTAKASVTTTTDETYSYTTSKTVETIGTWFVSSTSTFERTKAISFGTHWAANFNGGLLDFTGNMVGPQFINDSQMHAPDTVSRSFLGVSTELSVARVLVVDSTDTGSSFSTSWGTERTITYGIIVSTTGSETTFAGVTTISTVIRDSHNPAITHSTTTNGTTTTSQTVGKTTTSTATMAEESQSSQWTAYEATGAHTTARWVSLLTVMDMPITESSGGLTTKLASIKAVIGYWTTIALYDEPATIVRTRQFSTVTATVAGADTQTGSQSVNEAAGCTIKLGYATIRFDILGRPVVGMIGYEDLQPCSPRANGGWQFPTSQGTAHSWAHSTNQQLPISKNEFAMRGGVLIPMMRAGQEPWVQISGKSWTQQKGTTTATGLMAGASATEVITWGADTALEMIQLGMTHSVAQWQVIAAGLPACAQGGVARKVSYIEPYGIYFILTRTEGGGGEFTTTCRDARSMTSHVLETDGAVCAWSVPGSSITTQKVTFNFNRGSGAAPETIDEQFSAPIGLSLRYWSGVDYAQSTRSYADA